MKNLKLTTFARFKNKSARTKFNRLVRKAVPKFHAKTDKKTAVNCAIWETLEQNRDLWYIGPCIEHTNEGYFTWVSPETTTALFEVLA